MSKIKTIKAESGISLEVKTRTGGSQWYKLAYSEEVEVSAKDDYQKEKFNLWDRVNTEIEDQVEEVLQLVKGVK